MLGLKIKQQYNSFYVWRNDKGYHVEGSDIACILNFGEVDENYVECLVTLQDSSMEYGMIMKEYFEDDSLISWSSIYNHGEQANTEHNSFTAS